MSNIRYQLSDITYDAAEAEAVAEVLTSKWLSVGPRTAAFERRFAEFLDAPHAVAVSSCTAALHLALLAAGVGAGDEVLVPSYTFVASVNPILYVGARPVFVDISGPDDLNLDPTEVEAHVSPRTKAIVAVHMAGFPADMDRLMAIAEEHGLAVIEDACHAIGAKYESEGSRYDGRFAGTIGTVGCFSFFANKNLVTGEGGMLVTSDESIATRARLARSHGMTKTSWDKASGRATDYDVEQFGFNYRGTELTAALGLVQLGKLPDSNRRRGELVARYRDRLADVPGVTIPFADRMDSAHHIFPVLAGDQTSRDALRAELLERGVQTSIHYPPVHEFTQYHALAGDDTSLPHTVAVSRRELTLPLHPLLNDEDVDAICQAVRESVEAIASTAMVASAP